jgi:chromosome partitioning protein
MTDLEDYLINSLSPKLNLNQKNNKSFSNEIKVDWIQYDFNIEKFKMKVAVACNEKDMKVISIANLKGGVGKTTTAIHLGASLANSGRKTLIVDFDAQRNLSIGLNIPKDFRYTIKNFLSGEFDDIVLTQKEKNLFILSGSRDLLINKYKINELSKKLYEFKALNFDYVIIDCASRDSIEIALTASDYVVSPIEAEEFSMEGLNELFPLIIRLKNNYNQNLRFLGFFFNKVIESETNFKKFFRIASNEAKDYFFTSYIRHDVAVEKAKDKGETVYVSSPSSKLAKDYTVLAEEISKKIKAIETNFII